MDGYKKLTAVDIEVPAEMLESWAGYDAQDVDKEFMFAVACVDTSDAATLQWLAAGIERRLADLQVVVNS